MSTKRNTSSKVITRARRPKTCPDCNRAVPLVYAACPFAEDIHGDSTPIWLCNDCRDARAMDI